MTPLDASLVLLPSSFSAFVSGESLIFAFGEEVFKSIVILLLISGD